MLTSFAELVSSRQTWITEVLQPWCRQASWKELIQAHQDWSNLAGAVDPHTTLWVWAWSRFPGLVTKGLPGIDETHRVCVALRDGRTLRGFPDNRESRLGTLRLLCDQDSSPGCHELSEAISIDDVESVQRLLDTGTHG